LAIGRAGPIINTLTVHMSPPANRFVLAGLFLVTLATLLLENLGSRLLSVLTWYHLSFFAISLAMLGMAAGAIFVFLAGARLHDARARVLLARASLALALAIPISQVAILYVAFPDVTDLGPKTLAHTALATAVLGAPFLLAGVVVTLALTRVGGAIGQLYGADLLGAAAGCLLIVPLLNRFDITAVAFLTGAFAAIGAACFQRVAGGRGVVGVALALLLTGAALYNAPPARGFGVVSAKGMPLPRLAIDYAASNAHSYVIMLAPAQGPAFYWGRGAGAPPVLRRAASMLIDGAAGTVMTQWDGDIGSLGWVSADVTYLPYLLRRGDTVIIGVGGGRDILSALAAGSRSVTGVEVNGIFIDLLNGPRRDFAGIARRPEVRLVHDEARSYLSRTPGAFDVIQMSLVDTWAATTAGAFSLSENGLYTVEAFQVFLDALRPGGVLAVSRWFSTGQVSETNRLVALAVAALIERAVADPAAHVLLLTSGRIATLLVSNAPFTTADVDTFRAAAERRGFTVLLAPGMPAATPTMGRIIASRSTAELIAAAADPRYDYTPPTDDRPFFFNLLKPSAFLDGRSGLDEGVIYGNIRATTTLVALLAVAAALVALIILTPLAVAGRPPMPSGVFAAALAYFAVIGIGFMLIQIALVQRFSVYLGHPAYTLAVILFSMICFAGLGSVLSDRLDVVRRMPRIAVPVLIAGAIVVVALALGPAIAATVHLGSFARGAVVVGMTAPLSLLLGCCFPMGMRLVRRLAEDADAWMWGVNGACGVLGSIVAVAISMWLGISVNLALAALLYASLLAPMEVLGRAPADA
jgi:spermidine synthase